MLTPTNTHTTQPPVLRRPDKPRDWPTPVTYWLPMLAWQEAPLVRVLRNAKERGIQALYYVGGWDAAHTPASDWWTAPSADGWRIEGFRLDPPGARYYLDSYHIDVRMTAVWYGDSESPAACREAHHTLDGILRGAFGAGAHCMGTPGRTGLDLFERSLPVGAEYPAIPAKLAELIRHNIGQGRIEFCAPTDAAPVDELISLDARWMYAACVEKLPRGPVEHLEGAAARRVGFEKYALAFYRVVFRVPDDWGYSFGLLPAWNERTERTYWPKANTSPSSWYEAVVAEPELRVAVDMGWHVKVCEIWRFDPTGTPDPARNWMEKLRTLRARQHDPLVAGALRNIGNHTVGQWHRDAQRKLHITPVADKGSIPLDALDVAPYPSLADAREWRWYTPGTLHRDQLRYQHPEMSAYVWSYSRRRLVLRAIEYQRQTGGMIAAFRNDALVVTRDPQWVDDGRIGTFREKRRWLRGIELPDGSIWDGSIPRDELHYRQLLGAEGASDE